METLKKVLVVEDNPAFAAMIEKTLTTHHGVQVEAVYDGRSAIARVEKASAESEAALADLVLLDLELPMASGFEVLSALRGTERYRSLPVVILTHCDSEDEIERAYALGASNYVVKTKNLADAVSRIREYWLEFSRIPARH